MAVSSPPLASLAWAHIAFANSHKAGQKGATEQRESENWEKQGRERRTAALVEGYCTSMSISGITAILPGPDSTRRRGWIGERERRSELGGVEYPLGD
jgi:hypothetical protein